MTIYDATYIKDDAMKHEFELTEIDEIYRNVKNDINFIFKLGAVYYYDNYTASSYGSLLFTNNKVLKFSKVVNDDNFVNIFYKFNAYLTKVFGVDIYQYSSNNYKNSSANGYMGDGARFYYKSNGVTYLSEYPFASTSEIVIETHSFGGFYRYSTSRGHAEISSGVMTRFGEWSDEVFISGDSVGAVKVSKDTTALQAMATTPTEITLAQYLDEYGGSSESESSKAKHNVAISDKLANIYESPSGASRRIGYELWTYTEIIEGEPVVKEVKKNIELFELVRTNDWVIDDYVTVTEPKYSNSPQTLTRDSDGATIQISFKEYSSASEKIPICEGQSWR